MNGGTKAVKQSTSGSSMEASFGSFEWCLGTRTKIKTCLKNKQESFSLIQMLLYVRQNLLSLLLNKILSGVNLLGRRSTRF